LAKKRVAQHEGMHDYRFGGHEFLWCPLDILQDLQCSGL
jgi:hypothetical protein